jgi:hypothetical protein
MLETDNSQRYYSILRIIPNEGYSIFLDLINNKGLSILFNNPEATLP